MDINPKDFPGVTLGDLWELEELFDVSISVFSLTPDGASKVMWTLGSKRTWKLHLNLEQDHFSLIIDIAMYAKSSCARHATEFLRAKMLSQHTHVLQEMQPD